MNRVKYRIRFGTFSLSVALIIYDYFFISVKEQKKIIVDIYIMCFLTNMIRHHCASY